MRGIVPALICAAAAATPASAQRVSDHCTGLFLRNSQGYDFGSRRPNLVKAGPIRREGSEAEFNGMSTIRGKVYFSEVRSHMYPGADVQLPTGCRLMELDPSEPD